MKFNLNKASSLAELNARFQGAPEWVLHRVQKLLPAREGWLPGWKGTLGSETLGSGASLENWARDVIKKRAAEKAAAEWFREYPQYVGLVPDRFIVWAMENNGVKFSDQPTVENWSYEDDHPGDYVDSAWSTSKEVSPGAWKEKKHGLCSGTRRWLTVASPEVIRTRKEI